LISDIVLRAVAETDLPILFEYESDPVAVHMAAFTAKNPADRNAFNEHWRKILSDPEIIVRSIIFEGQLAGSIGSFVDPEFRKREVTYWIGRKYWGKGIATTALSAFLRFLKARPIYARTAHDNIASMRVLEKCGFKIIDYGSGFANARGKQIEEAILELRV
jgi:RimJ/RimL family protein N-acetyltransferase